MTTAFPAHAHDLIINELTITLTSYPVLKKLPVGTCGMTEQCSIFDILYLAIPYNYELMYSCEHFCYQWSHIILTVAS